MGRPKGSKNLPKGDDVVFIQGLPQDTAITISEPVEITAIERWVTEGVPCKYARFIAAVHPAPGKDPVNEFKLESKEAKYLVNSLIYTPHGLVFGVHGELGIVPLANISHVRLV